MSHVAESELRRTGDDLAPIATKTAKVVEIYVCPTPICRDYYGAVGMGDLAEKKTYPPVEHVAAHEERTGQRHIRSRACCPTCIQAGRTNPDGSPVERVKVAARVMV